MAVEQGMTGYPSIDKPWLKYYTTEDLEIKVPAGNIYQTIYDRNKNYPDDVAIMFFGNKIRYKTLFSNVEICTKALCQIGIQPGDCVNLCTVGVPEAIYIVLACSRIGAIANFINPLFTKEQMVDRINETEAKWVFVLDAMFSYIEESLSETCIQNVVIIPVTNSFPPFLSKLLYLKSEAKKIVRNSCSNLRFLKWKDFQNFSYSFSGSLDVPYKPDTPAIMVYSSGSTGASKGIMLTNDGINAFISAYDTTGYSDMAYKRGLTFLQMIPIWFSTGIVFSILMPLAKGFTVIPEPKFSKETFMQDLIKYKPEMTLTATSLWLYVVNSGKEIDLSNMLYPVTGGEKILPQDEIRINEYLKKNGCKKRFYKGYGMCELGSEISGTTDVKNYSDKPGGCGYPMLGVTVSAFSVTTGEELPYGERGELRVLSPARMKGYYKNPEATTEFFKTDENGSLWGCTGDIGYVDEDGEVFVLGRAKDHYHRENGEIVYLFDIEEEILKDSDVEQCKVIYFKNQNKTETVAHIVLKNNMGEMEVLTRIHRQLTNTLPKYMVPNYYKVRKAMPVHNNGKLDNQSLREDREDLISADQLK